MTKTKDDVDTRAAIIEMLNNLEGFIYDPDISPKGIGIKIMYGHFCGGHLHCRSLCDLNCYYYFSVSASLNHNVNRIVRI